MSKLRVKKNNRALITGGCGFIGSHLVDKLIHLNYEVIVIDDLSAQCNEIFYKNDKATYIFESINNYEKIMPYFYGIDYVFHLAAESRIVPALENPQLSCLTNFMGTCNILQAARRFNIRRVIYSSTAAYYGIKNQGALIETMPRDCLNPYSVSKIAAEDLVIMFHRLWSLPVVCLRYFNVFGERQPTKGYYAPVVGVFLEQKWNNRPLTVVGDGSQRRDFIYVGDVVEANMLAMDNNFAIGEIFNIGSGQNISILDLAKKISDRIVFLPPREGEAKDTLADISKSNRLLKFYPRVTIFDWLDRILEIFPSNQ